VFSWLYLSWFIIIINRSFETNQKNLRLQTQHVRKTKNISNNHLSLKFIFLLLFSFKKLNVSEKKTNKQTT